MTAGSEREPSPAGAADARGLPLTRLERASGIVWGLGDRPVDPLRPTHAAPLEALEAAIAPALQRRPCYVSFSGGRDSSTVLATATAAARRRGLADPIPVTFRFPGVASTHESDYQEMVVDHLGLSRWEILTFDEELDLLGDLARAALQTHGMLYPPNAYLHIPLLECARGGSLLTGFDGDGVLGNWRWERAQAVLHRRVRPEPRDLLRVALALAPEAVRRRRVQPVLLRVAPWLRPVARHEFDELGRRHEASEPRRWDRHVERFARSRHLRVCVRSLDLLGRARDVEVAHPLLDGGFMYALARAGGAAGWGSRTEVMRALFGALLPAELITRPGKAEFGRAIWHRPARTFAERWTGAGIDPELVDHDVLRAHWRTENPQFGAATLLQLAWLAS